jgi:hypothetical protein
LCCVPFDGQIASNPMDASQLASCGKAELAKMTPRTAGITGRWGAVTERVDMSTWTDEEIHTLISLWPTSSASQIGARLHRPRSAICGKVMRLRREGALPHGAYGHFDVNPRTLPQRRGRPPQIRILPPKPPPRVDDSLEMRVCSILELDATRCHWPLGNLHEVAVQFCGGNAAPGRRYCLHHLRIGRA